jgi:hypothetical protein
VTLGGGLQLNQRRNETETHMPSALKYAGSSFVTLASLRDKPPLLERISFVQEEVDGKYGDRLVMTFESGKKLSLNKTSVSNLRRDVDDNYDLWTGHGVKVFAGQVEFQNRLTDCVIVEAVDVDKPIQESRKALVERSPAKPARGVRTTTIADPKELADERVDMDDEIPF